MKQRAIVRAVCLSLILSISFTASAKDKKKKPMGGTPVLWQDPGDLSSRDLINGPGGEEMKPDLSHVTFIEEQTGGYSKKYRVQDGAGRTWVGSLNAPVSQLLQYLHGRTVTDLAIGRPDLETLFRRFYEPEHP